MASTGSEIIAALQEKYPDNLGPIGLRHCADRNLKFPKKVMRQYIVGVTRGDEVTPHASNYEQHLVRNLEAVSKNINCLSWHYGGNEIETMKSALRELAERFAFNIDIDQMIGKLEVPRDQSGNYYIVVAVVPYSIIYVE